MILNMSTTKNILDFYFFNAWAGPIFARSTIEEKVKACLQLSYFAMHAIAPCIY